METYAQVVVSKLSNQEEYLSAYEHVVQEIKTHLQTLDEFKVGWVHCSANSTAHVLGREGCINKLCKPWFWFQVEHIDSVVASKIAVT